MWWSRQVGNLNSLAFTLLPCCLNELTQLKTEIFGGCCPSIQSLGTCLLTGSSGCILLLLTLKSLIGGPEVSATII